MKKVIMALLVAALIALRLMGAGQAEMTEAPQWAFDPRIVVYTVDKIEDEGRYTTYICVDEEYIISIDRRMEYDFGKITMTRGDFIYYESEYWSEYEGRIIMDELVYKALELVGDKVT